MMQETDLPHDALEMQRISKGTGLSWEQEWAIHNTGGKAEYMGADVSW